MAKMSIKRHVHKNDEKKTVKSLNTIDSKSFELHDIISFNKPTTLEYPIRITRITYRL